MDFSVAELLPNITFKASRSSGKGGQNVNKVSSKVELNFDFESSSVFDADQKSLLKQKLGNRLTADGKIQVISEEERSQYLNKELTIQKLYRFLKNALYIQKSRKTTKPKKSSIEKRLKSKQIQAQKKISRKKNIEL